MSWFAGKEGTETISYFDGSERPAPNTISDSRWTRIEKGAKEEYWARHPRERGARVDIQRESYWNRGNN